MVQEREKEESGWEREKEERERKEKPYTAFKIQFHWQAEVEGSYPEEEETLETKSFRNFGNFFSSSLFVKNH